MRRIYKTGEPCPCCGLPIPLTDPDALLRLTGLADLMGLPDLREAKKEDDSNAEI